MSVLKAYFDKNVNQSSPVKPDFDRVVKYDEDGNEFIIFVKVDYPSIQEANGSAKDWSLDSLMKAGINPNFSIHTGLNTRLEGFETVNAAAAELDAILAGERSESNESE